MRSMIGRLERALVEALRIVVVVAIVVFFAFLIYKVFDRWGFEILFLGSSALLIYGFCGRFPDFLARRHGWTRWQAEKRIRLWALFFAGIVVGAYWIPKEMNFATSWYWRTGLGVALGCLALITRRYA